MLLVFIRVAAGWMITIWIFQTFLGVRSGAIAQTTQGVGLAVSVAHPNKRCFSDLVEVTGVLVPRQEVEVRPDREGLRVMEVLAGPWDEVGSGQILARLRTSESDGGQTLVAIRSPVLGIIGRSTAVVGLPTSAQGEPLFQIIVQGELDFKGWVPVAYMTRIAPGQTVVVKPIGEPGISGRVQSVGPGVDPATQLGPVRIMLDRSSRLRPGMFARGTIRAGDRCGIAVPFSSLLNGPEGTAVYVVSNNLVEARLVRAGLSSGNEIEIHAGLSEKDLVVVRAGPFLREGDLVRPVIIELGTN